MTDNEKEIRPEIMDLAVGRERDQAKATWQTLEHLIDREGVADRTIITILEKYLKELAEVGPIREANALALEAKLCEYHKHIDAKTERAVIEADELWIIKLTKAWIHHIKER